MPLKVTRRAGTGALTITGTVAGTRIRRRAQSDDPKLAAEEAATIEADRLRTRWHGERRGSRTFAEAALNYIEAAPRSENTKARVRRLLLALGTVTLAEVDQDTAIRLRSVLRPGAKPATYLREVVVPLRAIMRHAADRGWTAPLRIATPRIADGRTRYLLPDEAERLLHVAAPHIRPLLLFLLGTGARMSEALELQWRDVDLKGARAIFWRTKGGKRRVATIPPRIVALLANLPRSGAAVFRRRDGKPYAYHHRAYGGQVKTAWKGAIRRAQLDPELTPHDLRHTWASWHYAVHRDLLALKVEGGWSSVTLVERYAHLLPKGHEAAILDWHRADTAEQSTTAAC
jgi:integrase